MDEETLARLRRLGVVKGARQLGRPRPLNSPPPAGDEPPTYIRPGNNTPSDPAGDDPPQPLPALLPGGQMVDTPLGQCFILDTVYPLAHRHGQDRLEDLLQYTPAGAVPLTGDPRLAGLDFRDFLFLDTETTGLGGAGALAFMVGTAFFEGDALVVRQYFLPDLADEPALLHLLEALLAGRAGLI
ncbi:MAG: ribonuclease H-like domain-containing protein, partial [Anaerolineales bacterium]|nr:ribonuclease H-like domain-containing protein [Anaerolineales bacterium]